MVKFMTKFVLGREKKLNTPCPHSCTHDLWMTPILASGIVHQQGTKDLTKLLVVALQFSSTPESLRRLIIIDDDLLNTIFLKIDVEN